MKAILFPFRVLLLIAFAAVVHAVFLYDAAREAWLKRKLGADYEGPAAD